MESKEREEGYYWVDFEGDGKWEVCQYLNERYCFLDGSVSNNVTVINETRIPEPVNDEVKERPAPDAWDQIYDVTVFGNEDGSEIQIGDRFYKEVAEPESEKEKYDRQMKERQR